MFKSILSIIYRNFFRNLYYSLITLSSLVVGISTAVLIFVWVGYELSYDKQDTDASRVFMVMINELRDGEIQTQDETYVPLAELFTNDVSEVEAMTRIDNTEEQLTLKETSVSKYGAYVDSTFFKVFKTTIKEGLTTAPLSGKHSIAVSDQLAQLLFPNTNAVGKFISLGVKGEFKVTAVFESYPENNSLNYIHFVLPFNAIPRQSDEWQDYYVKLNKAQSKTAVEKKVDAKFKEFFKNDQTTSLLFCLTDWRLHWNFENGKISGGRITYVIIFTITGIFILLMACVNYMNIATARATKRAKEIGVRKMTGASQKTLITQFLSESLIFSFLATFISVLLVYLLMPSVRELTGLPLQFSITNPVIAFGLTLMALFSGLVAGSYPAFMLSSFKPASVLKGNLNSALTGAGLRGTLVVFQFVLSNVMIFGAMIMWRQTEFLLKKDVGYDKHNVINVWLPSDSGLPLDPFKDEISNHSSVEAVAYGGASPMEVNGYAEVKWSGMPSDPVYLYGVSADFDMVQTLGLKIIQGRNFSKDFISDSSGFIITKRAAAILGFANPIGQRITYTMFGDREGEIIGVIDDFNNDDIHLPIAPVLFCIGKPGNPGEINNMFIRYREGQQDAALKNLKKVFSKYQLGLPLNYSFLDTDYVTQLNREVFLGKLSISITIIAIAISCLGLLGLTLFNVERRTKEIGIRKVLGASISQMMSLLFKEFLKPVFISFLIAFPIAYYFMNQYLEGFAYRISINVFSFLLAAIAMIFMIILIVSYQSYKAANKNPVDALKID